MSLKSFDKFCEKMINSEPIDNKDIFDERQNVLRTQITVQAMRLFIVLSCFNILTIECGPQWCESYIASTALFAGIAYIYWLIQNGRNGSLFGIKGTKPLEYQAAAILCEGIIFPLYMFGHRQDFFQYFFVKNGMVSEYLMLTLFFVMCVASGITVFVLAHRYKKKTAEE